jgi:hypothetical protein
MVIRHALESELEFLAKRATPEARDSMTRYWYSVEVNGDSVSGSWKHFLANPAVQDSLMEVGITHPSK